MRSSGVGQALGVGRVGQVLGPLVIGLLLSHQVGQTTIFLLESVPCAVAALAAIAFEADMPSHPPLRVRPVPGRP